MSNVNFNHNNGYNVSSKYIAINTGSIVSQFEAAGFTLDRLSKAKVKDASRQGFQKHLLVFRHSALQLRNVGDSMPEILLKNSYDGSSSFQVFLGVYRLVCSNGLMVGTTYDSVRVRHVGANAVAKAIDGALQIATQFDSISETINRMQTLQLNESQAINFASEAWALVAPKSAVNVQIDSLLQARRNADTGTDLWSIFNRIQENIVRGGVRFQTINGAGQLRNATRRSMRAIDATVDTNKQLWTIAESLLRKVG